MLPLVSETVKKQEEEKVMKSISSGQEPSKGENSWMSSLKRGEQESKKWMCFSFHKRTHKMEFSGKMQKDLIWLSKFRVV